MPSHLATESWGMYSEHIWQLQRGHARATLGRGSRPAAAWLAAPSDEHTGEGHTLCFCVEEQQSPWKGVPPASCSIPEGLRQPTALSSAQVPSHDVKRKKKEKKEGGLD